MWVEEEVSTDICNGLVSAKRIDIELEWYGSNTEGVILTKMPNLERLIIVHKMMNATQHEVPLSSISTS